MSIHDFSHGAMFLLQGKEYVVKKSGSTEVVLENIQYGLRETFLVDELLNAWILGELHFKLDTESKVGEIEDEFELVPEKQQKEAKRRYAILEPFIKGEKIYADLEAHLIEHDICQGTFYNWFRTWMKYRDIRYLIPINRGPRKATSDANVALIAAEVIKDMAYEGVKVSVRKMYSELRLRVKEVNEFRSNKDKLEEISMTTFWRIYRSEKDLHKQNLLKYGKQKADLIRKGSRGRIHTERILERVEIDWTLADILLVNPITLKRQRPWLVYAIDVHSGHPLGFHTTFETPDTAAIKQCLLHCFLPKTYIKDVYPLIQKEWVAYGIPKEIILDNATVNESHDLRDACRIYGIDIQYCSIASGHQKGTIERAFRTLNQKLIHGSPGTTFSNPYERAEYDSEGEACITLQAFNYLVHVALVDMISHDWRHSVTRSGVPHVLWQKSLAENPHLKLAIPRNLKELKIVMGSGLEFRTITNKGITLEGVNFQSSFLADLRYDLDKLNRDKEEVRVRYDKDDLRVIYIRDPINETFVEAYPDEEILADKKIRLDLPVPFYQIQLRSVEKSGELTQHHKDNDEYFGKAGRAVAMIIEQQRKDMSNGYPETLAEIKSQLLEFSEVGEDLTKLSFPSDISSINSIEEVDKPDKKKKPKKNGSNAKIKEPVEEVSVTMEDSGQAEDEEELPSYRSATKGAS